MSKFDETVKSIIEGRKMVSIDESVDLGGNITAKVFADIDDSKGIIKITLAQNYIHLTKEQGMRLMSWLEKILK